MLPERMVVTAPVRETSNLLIDQIQLATYGPSRHMASIGSRTVKDLVEQDFAHRKRIIEMIALHRVPAIYPFRYVAAEGGLASYGVDVTDLYRRAADYVDRVLVTTSPPTFPCRRPSNLSLSSTPGPPKRSASLSRSRCSPPLTK
jgi:hypothetical protein